MSTFRTILLAGAVSLAPAHALAAPKEAPIAIAVVPANEAAAEPDSAEALAAAKAKMQKEIDQAIAMVEKIFAIDTLPPIDPARLTLAQKTTAALVPAGSLEKMVDNMYGTMFRALMAEMGGMSDTSLSIKTGVDGDQIAKMDDASKAAAADLFDPYRKQREEQITRIVKPLISEVLGDMEAPMRGGMARAYARKLTAPQLTELNAFFATPAGSAYASEWMALQADPEVMVAIIKAVPPLINKFIDRAPQLESQFKDIPKEKTLADFSDADIAKLAKLMQVDAAALKEHRDMWNVDNDTAMAAEDAVDAASHDDAAYDRANWSEADLKRVEDLEAAADTASAAAFDAEQQAAANARKRLKPST